MIPDLVTKVITALAVCLVSVGVALGNPTALAQESTSEPKTQPRKHEEEFEVGVGQVTSAERPEPEAGKDLEEKPALVQRTQEEASRLVDSLTGVLHSGCCPAKKMNDTTCPCHDFQLKMLMFLARRGFTLSQMRQLMVDGVNKESLQKVQWQGDLETDFEAEYRDWLVKEGEVPESMIPRYLEIRSESGLMGFRRGWSSLVLEGPNRLVPWILIGLAGISVLAVFLYGVKMVVGRNSAGESDHQSGRSDEIDPQRIKDLEAEAEALSEEF